MYGFSSYCRWVIAYILTIPFHNLTIKKGDFFLKFFTYYILQISLNL